MGTRRWPPRGAGARSPRVQALLDRGRERAQAERLDIAFKLADAEALPFDDGAYDAVTSTFGVMFAPAHDVAAREMARVCRRGGKIGMANWTPDGFIGALFKTIGAHVPPPAGVKSPALWGTEAHLAALFGATAASIHVERRSFAFRYRSPAHWIEVFRTYYGPVHKAYAALDAKGQEALTADLMTLIARFNRVDDATMVAPAEYLQVVITRR
jgi:SAM-dependent methyltransferase